VIADRTANDVRYTGKLSNRFRLQVYEQLVYARSDSMGTVYERTQTLSTQGVTIERDRPKMSRA